MSCKHCAKALNKSQRKFDEKGIEYKSCPACSTRNGENHVFRPYPSAFGETSLRASEKDPRGAQSYCTECRGGGHPKGGILCSKL